MKADNYYLCPRKKAVVCSDTIKHFYPGAVFVSDFGRRAATLSLLIHWRYLQIPSPPLTLKLFTHFCNIGFSFYFSYLVRFLVFCQAPSAIYLFFFFHSFLTAWDFKAHSQANSYLASTRRFYLLRWFFFLVWHTNSFLKFTSIFAWFYILILFSLQGKGA